MEQIRIEIIVHVPEGASVDVKQARAGSGLAQKRAQVEAVLRMAELAGSAGCGTIEVPETRPSAKRALAISPAGFERLRRVLVLTRREAAEYAGVSESTVFRLEERVPRKISEKARRYEAWLTEAIKQGVGK